MKPVLSVFALLLGLQAFAARMERPPVWQTLSCSAPTSAEQSCMWSREVLGFDALAGVLTRAAAGGQISQFARSAFLPDGRLRPEVLATARRSIAHQETDADDAVRTFNAYRSYLFNLDLNP